MTFEHRTAATAWGGSETSVAAPDDGGGSRSPAARIGRLGRALAALRQSPWTAVALRCAAILIGMLVLAAIGAVSIKKSFEGSARLAGALGHSGRMANASHDGLATQINADLLLPGVGAPDAGVARAHAGCERAPGPPAVTGDGKVILNRASVQDLRRLPGIGRRRAEQIIELRTRLKRFRRVSDLLRVRGIGVRALKRLEPHVVLDAPSAPDAG